MRKFAAMQRPQTTVRSRIAPTPSGYLHFGNLYAFVCTALLTQSLKGALRLRIDDLDRSRYRRAYLEDIFRLLDELKLPITEGPTGVDNFERHYSQTLHSARYQAILNRLYISGHVYVCRCSRKDFSVLPQGERCGCKSLNLAPEGSGVVWRLSSIPEEHSFKDLDGLSHVVPLQVDPGYIPLRQRDGHASYQIASLSDDINDRINLIMRGYDLIPSTAMQLHLSDLLEDDMFKNVHFFHHSLIKVGGKKLSKSAGTSKKSLLDNGLTAENCYQQIAEILRVDASHVNSFETLFERTSENLIQRMRGSLQPPIDNS